MAGAVIAPVLNPMGEGLAVSPNYARLIITTHSIFIALFSPLSGFLIDRFGVKKPFIIGLLIYGFAGASGMFITSYGALIASRIILGIGISAIFTAITVILLNLYQGPQRNHVMGWRSSSNNVGGVIWPVLGGFLGTFSWHAPFAAYLAGIPLGILVLLLIPETESRAVPSLSTSGNGKSILSLFKDTPVLYITYGLAFLTMFFLYTNVVFMPTLAAQLGRADPLDVGLLLATQGIAAAITSGFYGRIRAVLSYKAMIMIVLPVWVIGFIIMSQAYSIWMVALAMMLFGTGMGVIMPSVAVWTGESVPASFRGRFTSYLATFGFVGQFFSSVILGPVASSFGLSAVFIVIAGVAALVFVLFLAFFRE